MNHTYSKTKAKSGADPCSCATHQQVDTCCNLMCFERPNYFCGHLLTDRDLSKQQQYVIEKNKLYHRALHGQGVVCGLRLTCHHECPGHIMIDEGYAIDACGNDLVVCEPQPFDVIALLRAKKLILEPFPTDPCKPEDERPECEEIQCFYVAMCYDEEPADFTTPLVAGCRSDLTECEPTRIRESVRFDILDELPEASDWPTLMTGRLEGCATLFIKGPFAQLLQDKRRLLEDLFTMKTVTTEGHQAYWQLFAGLRELFLRHLKKYPDNYNCSMTDEVMYLPTLFPANEEERTNVVKKIQDAFCRLLELVNSYVTACIMGEAIFPCPPASKTSCVVLGTVEIKNGRLWRVCNCPRSYVWSFATFWEVLMATVQGAVNCGEEEEATYVAWQANARSASYETGINQGQEEKKAGCCNEPEFDCVEFIKRLLANRQHVYAGSLAIPRMATALRRSLQYHLNFSNPRMLAFPFLSTLPVAEFEKTAKDYSLSYTLKEQPAEAAPPSPLEVFQSFLMTAPDRPLVAYKQGDQVIAVQPDTQQMATLNPQIQTDIENQIKQASDQAVAADTRAQDTQAELVKAQAELANKNTELEGMKEMLAAMQAKVTAVESGSNQMLAAMAKFADVERDVNDLKLRMPLTINNEAVVAERVDVAPARAPAAPAAPEAAVPEAAAPTAAPAAAPAAPEPAAAPEAAKPAETTKPKRTRKKPPQQ